MADLSTTYMGLELKNPIIISSSGLTGTIESIEKCVKAGAAAVVLKSIFEEEILGKTEEEARHYDVNAHPEAELYAKKVSFEHNVEDYLELIRGAKKVSDVPVIASMNCATDGEWTDFASRIEEAGADGIELNLLIFPKSVTQKSHEIEDLYIKIFKEVKKHTTLPIGVKLTSLFTNVGNLAKRLNDEGAAAIVLFNRFQTVFTEEDEADNPQLEEGKWLSSPGECVLTQKWISKIYNELTCDLSATSGLRSSLDIIRQVKAGAASVQLASVIYLNGLSYINELLKEIEVQLKDLGYESFKEVKGMHSAKNVNKHSRSRYYKAISVLNQYEATH